MTKDRNILLEVKKLIFQYGIKSLTMDDISQHLGISKKTLYLEVENKADLIDKLIEQVINDQEIEFCEVTDQPGLNAIDELLEIYRCNAVMAKAMNPSLLYELKKYYPASYERLDQFRWGFAFKSIIGNLEKGISNGLYRPDLNIQIVARLYTSRILEIFNSGLFPPDQFPPALILREMFTYHIRGIASTEGIHYLDHKTVIDF